LAQFVAAIDSFRDPKSRSGRWPCADERLDLTDTVEKLYFSQ
jgi:hypothetical protein